MRTPSKPEDNASVPGSQRYTALETTLLAGGLALFVVLLYEMLVLEAFLTPPLIAIAALILLWPLRQHRTTRAILFAGGFLMAFWFLEELSSILTPFVAVYLLAYLFDPMVTTLEARHNVPRWVSSFGVTMLLVGLVVLFIFLIVPSVVNQIEVLAARLVNSIGLVREWIITTTLLDNLEETGLVDKQQLIVQLTTFAQEQINALASSIPNAAQRLLSSIGSLLALITTVTIIPVVLFYTLKDYPFIKRRLVELFPTFGGRRDYLVHAGGIVGNYLRGQLTISAIAAFNVSVVLLLFNVPFALLIGLMGGLMNMIPQIGIIVTNVVAVVIALIFGDPWYLDVIIVLAVLMGQSLLEQAVLTPNILSYQVGLHPVLIILSLFIFGYFLGIFGFLIAVPATALIMTVYKSYRDALTLELTNGGDRLDPTDRVLRRQTESIRLDRSHGETFGDGDATKATSPPAADDERRGSDAGRNA